MQPKLCRILLYAKDMEKTARFYVEHFGFTLGRDPDGRIFELAAAGGMNLMIHRLSAGKKAGQSQVKFVFDVDDVEGFVAAALRNGLKFGAPHKADGYVFGNCKDPSGNLVSVSSRSFRTSSK